MQINCNQLKSYLENHVLGTTIDKLKPINRGGSSLNFLCYTKNKNYLIKAINKEKKERIVKLCNKLQILEKHPLIYTAHLEQFNNQSFFEYENWAIMVISYIKGKKLQYKDITPELIDKIYTSYIHISELKIDAAPQKNLPLVYEDNKNLISELISANKGKIKQKILQAMYKLNEAVKTDFTLNTEVKIIHGDASLNNCLQDKNKNIALLDFELARYGYEVEDWAEFFLSSISQHSIIFIPQKRLERLIRYTNSLFNFTKQEWIWATNQYFLNLINKRVKSKKLFKSIRKSILFTLNLKKHKSIISVIEKIY